MATETTKIVRMQQRRGLKQDLPKPLRPGEIGFATDSRQVFIGADTEDAVSQIYNKTGAFEKTSSAQSTTVSFANVQMVKFTVPHKIYDKGEFDGVTDSVSWTPESNVASSAGLTEYSRIGTVFSSTDTNYKNISTANVFQSTDITVVKNGVELLPANTASIPSGKDYYFSQTGNISDSGHPHQITFRTPPSGSEEVSISYYGNSTVISALSDTTFITGVPGFYADQGITNYRQLSNNHIRVAPGTGVGFIGLQFKHIQVATDVKHTPVTVSSDPITLGNIYFSKNSDYRESVAMTANATAVTLSSNITSGTYSTSSNNYNRVYIQDASDWLDNKVLQVTYYDAANSIVHARLPSNAASLTRTVSGTLANVSGNLQLAVSSVSDIQTGDRLYFFDSANTSGLDSASANVVSVSGSTKLVTVEGLGSTANLSANTSVLTFMTLKGSSSNTVVITSEDHGLADGANTIITSQIGTPVLTSGNITVTTTGASDSFILTAAYANVPAQGNATALTFTPVVSSANITATPVLAIDLSSANTVTGAKTIVNDLGLWPKLNNVPGAPLDLYVTHAESVQKTPFDFTIHNDQTRTLTTLGLTADSYSRSDSTVKAKLENWLDAVQSNASINLFKDIYVNTEFNSTGHFITWDPLVDAGLGEMNFESRFEARDFSYILNSLYFESVNPDIRGLLNIKTNIEMLTTEALAAGTATTSYTAPEQISIPAGTSPISELGIDMSGSYHTVFIEYSIKDDNAGSSNNYRRVGTIMYSGDSEAADVAFNDTYSDLQDNVSGNITFTASVVGTDVVITANNTLSPSGTATMRYIVRRWGD